MRGRSGQEWGGLSAQPGFVPGAVEGRERVRALPAGQRYGPMHTRTDLNIEKSLGNPEGRRLSLGLAVFNLFNQKDVRSVTPHFANRQIDFDDTSWQRWGISGRTPSGNAPVEVYDINNYWDAPREVTFSIRIKW